MLATELNAGDAYASPVTIITRSVTRFAEFQFLKFVFHDRCATATQVRFRLLSPPPTPKNNLIKVAGTISHPYLQ